MTLEEELAAWLPGQRWFAGKGAPIAGLAIVEDTPLVDGDPGMRHLIVAVAQEGATAARGAPSATRCWPGRGPPSRTGWRTR